MWIQIYTLHHICTQEADLCMIHTPGQKYGKLCIGFLCSATLLNKATKFMGTIKQSLPAFPVRRGPCSYNSGSPKDSHGCRNAPLSFSEYDYLTQMCHICRLYPITGKVQKSLLQKGRGEILSHTLRPPGPWIS